MIERDDRIPPLAQLLAELERARAVADQALTKTLLFGYAGGVGCCVNRSARMSLARLQHAFQAYVLEGADAIAERIEAGPLANRERRLASTTTPTARAWSRP